MTTRVDLTIPESGWRGDLFLWLILCIRSLHSDVPDHLRRRVLSTMSPNFLFRARQKSDEVDIGIVITEDWLVILLNGTEGLIQWLEDLILFTFDFSSEGKTIRFEAHLFFSTVARKMRDIAASLAGDAITRASGKRVIVAGHSLGGAVAAIMAHALYHDMRADVHAVVTFGAPRAGEAYITQPKRWKVIRITNFWDPVPYLPPTFLILPISSLPIIKRIVFTKYAHAGLNWTLQSDGGRIQSYGERPYDDIVSWFYTGQHPPLTPPQVGEDIRSITAHDTPEYARRVRQQLPSVLHPLGSSIPGYSQLDDLARELMAVGGVSWPFGQHVGEFLPTTHADIVCLAKQDQPCCRP